jgi:ankyrin repeat protein
MRRAGRLGIGLLGVALMVPASPASACTTLINCPMYDAIQFSPPALALLDAARAGNWRGMQRMLAVDPALASARTMSGETLLHRAMQLRSKRAFRLLLRAGAIPATGDPTGEHILLIAARVRDADWLAMLLESGIGPDIKRLPGEEIEPIGQSVPIGVAMMAGRDRQFDMLLAAGSNVNLTDRTGNSPLHLAAQINQPWQALALLKAGADPLARNAQGQSFQRYLFMTRDALLTDKARKGRAAVEAWLRARGIPTVERNAAAC